MSDKRKVYHLEKRNYTFVAKGRGESPRMEKIKCEGQVVGRKGKHQVQAVANLGQSTKMYQTVSRVSQRGHIGQGTRDLCVV